MRALLRARVKNPGAGVAAARNGRYTRGIVIRR